MAENSTVRSVAYDLLRSLGPSIDVPGGGARAVLTFQEFKDFRPDRLVARVPAIADLMNRALRAEGRPIDPKSPRRLIIKSVSANQRSRRPTSG